MRRVPIASVVAMWCLSWLAVPVVAEAPRPMGWRGDGTGKYPQADPPVTWGRVSKAVKGLRFQARRPKEGDVGQPMPDGVVREWLVLGPAAVAEDAKADAETLPGGGQFAPDEDDKCGELVWKRVAADTAYLDFAALFGARTSGAAYACTHIHSEAGGAFRLNLTHVGPIAIWANGKAVKAFAGRVKLDLAKGWNRVLLKAQPGEADWFIVFVLYAWPPAEYEETNIAWRTPLPGVAPGFYGGGHGVGSPVIVGDRICLLSEPHDLICLNKADGRILWLRTNSYFDAATEEDRKHPAHAEAAGIQAALDEINGAIVAGTASPKQLEQKPKLEKELYGKMKGLDEKRYKRPEIPDVGFSGFAPVTDGQFLYVWFASGVTACYDLEGNRRWIRVDIRPAVEHGFSSSPLLVDGKVVVFMRDLMAFDARTGERAWLTRIVSHEGLNPQGFFHGTPFATSIGGVGVIALGNGMIVRASDGKILLTSPEMGNQGIASPVVEGGTLFQASSHSMQLFMHTLPGALADPLKLETRTVSVKTDAFPKYYMPWHLSSPVVHEGLAYLLNNSGVLTVVDVEKAEIVYQKLLDLDAFQWVNEGAARGIGVSPALAGRHLYFFGNSGGALVIEPGRAYKQVAKNKIESVVMTGHWSERQERFIANPIFDGQRLYIRGEGTLYAIGP